MSTQAMFGWTIAALVIIISGYALVQHSASSRMIDEQGMMQHETDSDAMMASSSHDMMASSSDAMMMDVHDDAMMNASTSIDAGMMH